MLLQVEIHKIDGLVKDSTQCAPNGYYFIPVYDKVNSLMTDMLFLLHNLDYRLVDGIPFAI